MQLHPHFPSKEMNQENLARDFAETPPPLKIISHDLHMCPRAFLSSALQAGNAPGSKVEAMPATTETLITVRLSCKQAHNV